MADRLTDEKLRRLIRLVGLSALIGIWCVGAVAMLAAVYSKPVAASDTGNPRRYIDSQYGVVCYLNNVDSRAAVSISCVKLAPR